MSKCKITSFFTSLEDKNNNKAEQKTTVTPKQNKINWPSVKTVKKWETERNINLRHDVDDDGNVKTIICIFPKK